MKNKNLTIAGIVIMLVFSVLCNIISASTIREDKDRIEELQHYSVELKQYQDAIRLSDVLFDNNQLWDRDGSDVMEEYLNLRANMDTTFYSRFHKNSLLDNLSADFYDE